VDWFDVVQLVLCDGAANEDIVRRNLAQHYFTNI
jgi:hypothetical protein